MQEVAKMVPGVSALSVCWPHHLSYFCPHPQIWTRKFLPVPWLLCGLRRYDSSSFKVTGGDYTFGSQGRGAGSLDHWV